MSSAVLQLAMQRDDIDFDLRDIDEDILDLLEEGRQTRQNLAALLDVTGEYVYQRMDILIKLGVVEKIHDGFYQLREQQDDASDEADATIESDTARPAGTAETVGLPDDLEQEIERWRGQMERNNVSDIDARVRAARAVGQLVASEGAAKSDAVAKLLPEFEYPGCNEETWWTKVAKERFSNVESIQWDQSAQKYRVVDSA